MAREKTKQRSLKDQIITRKDMVRLMVLKVVSRLGCKFSGEDKRRPEKRLHRLAYDNKISVKRDLGNESY